MSNNNYQQAMHEAVLDSSPVAITTFDLDGRITSWNPAAEALFGYFQDEAIGQSIVDLLSQKDDRHALVIDPAKMIEEHGRIWLTAKQLRKELPPIDVELIGVPVDVEGETVGYLAMYSDTTEIQQINEELRSQKEYFEALFENSPVAVVTADLEGIVVSWSPTAEKLFGYSQEEVIGANLDDIVVNHPSIRDEGINNTDHVLNVGRVQMTTRRTRKDGSLVDVELLALPVIVGGEKVGFIAIYHDLTEVKNIERELRSQKEYFEAIFDNSPVAIVTADLEGNVVTWNPSAEKLFGYAADEVIGVDLDDIVGNHPAIREEALEHSAKVLNEGLIQITTKRTRKDGSLIDVELLGLPVIAGGEKVGFVGIYHDISALMAVERELRHQKEYFQALFENTPGAVVTADLEGNVVSWNPIAEKLFGYTKEEVIGSFLDDFIADHPSIHAQAVGFTEQVMTQGRVQATARRTRKDGAFVEVELLSLPVLVAGEKIGYITIYHDISELKNVERELRHQKEYYEALFRNNPVAVVTTDMEVNVVSWNPATEKLFGYREQEAVGKNLDDLVATDERVRDEAINHSAKLTSRKTDLVHLTTQRTRKDGSLVDVEAIGVPVFVGGGQVGFIALYYDITELKGIERELRKQKAVFEAILENSPVALVNVDLQGNVLYWNKESERLFEYSVEEAIGKNVDDLVAGDETIREEAGKITEELFRTRKLHVTAKRTRKDGSLVDVEFSALPVTLGEEIIGYAAAYHDISQLLEARLQAEAANQAKSDFLARMSHELRTPLNAIIGFTRLVKRKGEQALPEKQLDNLDKVLVSAEHLLGLINDILDISKIEAGRIEVDPSNFEIEPLINLCMSTTMPLVKRKGVILQTEGNGSIATLYSDENKIKQILLNLLSNSAKFTHQGHITVTTKQEKDSLVLSVSDSGIGIPEDALERIFEEFQQVDTSTTREYGGTGLGLSISHKLATLLGGDLTARSNEGEGATFTLTVPMHYQEPEEDRLLQD